MRSENTYFPSIRANTSFGLIDREIGREWLVERLFVEWWVFLMSDKPNIAHWETNVKYIEYKDRSPQPKE